MGFNFRKSIKIAPGVRLNIGKKGISSVSVGRRGARVSVSKKGTRTTVGLPGTGLSHTSYSRHKQNELKQNIRRPDFDNPNNFLGYPKSEWWMAGIVGFIILMIFIWVIS